MQNSGNSDKKEKISLVERLKGVKHIDIIIAVLTLVVCLALYFGVFNKPKDEVVHMDNDGKDFTRELESVLSSIEGVGKSKVIISYDNNKVVEIAHREESETRVDKDGTVSVIASHREPIIVRVNGEEKPIVLKETEGKIDGIVVVARGAENVKVRMNIIDAISTLLDVRRDKIKVYPMTK